MATEDNKDLGLSDDDTQNIKLVVDDLIDLVVKFSNLEETTEADYAALKAALDFANFVVSGIIYANGLDLCAGHDHAKDDDE